MSAKFTGTNGVDYEIIDPAPAEIAKPEWYESIARGGMCVPTYVRVLAKPYHIDGVTVGECYWCALLPATIAAAKEPTK